ncbi:acetyl-CoA synthetase-like protein [Gonapodya prolifera JEL478]|uniref:Acetyl-CoA synthetase-like protein n=1 Tax=Gonapodya prolifera (strain JEL478) TaxID=1344416 RepID=A0A138ZYI0_GONPJ|nr:acetyl-CoA synthetase-like protein [Gonapodya prolifera JEL478]|eukprot:KXS09562.1 acetyl-CoA synthetase-like protein [Gonapodya prolifera JEL478]
MVHIKAASSASLPDAHVNCAHFVFNSPYLAGEDLDAKTAIIDPTTSTRLTYARLFHLARTFSRGLLALFPSAVPSSTPSPSPSPAGTPTNRIVITIFSPNDILYPVVSLGAILCNDYLEGNGMGRDCVVVSTTNAALTSYECASQWASTSPALLVAHPSLLPRARDAWSKLGRDSSTIIALDAPGWCVEDSPPAGQYDAAAESGKNGERTMAEVLQAGMAAAQRGAVAPAAESESAAVPHTNGTANGMTNGATNGTVAHPPLPSPTAFILFSSGTTSGKSTPVPITHRNIVSTLRSLVGAEVLTPQRDGEPAIRPKKDVVMGVVPLFHAFGMFNLCFTSLYSGLTIVLFSKFDANRVVDSIDEFSVNIGFVVPPMLLMMTRVMEKRTTNFHPTLRWLQSAAAPLLGEVIAGVRRVFDRDVLRNGFGMTEIVATMIATGVGEPLSEGFAGRLNPNNEAKIVHPETGEHVGYNEPGELYVRGPQVIEYKMDGSVMVDAEGWLHTGDVATVDETNNFVIRDRIREMIKVNGISVAPADIETVLLDHPYVVDAAVISIPHPSAGECPKAFVVMHPDKVAPLYEEHGGDEEKVRGVVRDSLKAWSKERMARHKQPDGGIEFVKEIPKNPSGKILRRLLKGL